MQHDVPLLLPEIGVNVNDKRQPFTDQILDGSKTIETRSAPTLHPYVGKKVGLVRTGKGKAMLVGYVTIGEPKLYTTASSFDRDYKSHLVGKDSPFHISKTKKGSKWGYSLENVEKIEPRLLKDGTGVAPNPRVARKLQKIADHVRVKLARTPSQPATAESFGSLASMSRNREAHIGIGGPFVKNHPTEKDYHGIPRTVTDDTDSVRNSSSTLHFVAHDPDQLSHLRVIQDAFGFRPRSVLMHDRGRPTYLGQSEIMVDRNPNDGEKEYPTINEINSGQGAVRRLVGIPPRDDGHEPTVFFKSYRSAKLASLLTGGHVESVAFDPRRVANMIKGTSEWHQSGTNAPMVGVRGAPQAFFYDLRGNKPHPDYQSLAQRRVQSANIINDHPVFGEYITNPSSLPEPNDGAWRQSSWMEEQTHRLQALSNPNAFRFWQPSEDIVKNYGNPPLHFTPEILDDVGRELHAQVVANPGDHLARAVLADHLDNMGHHEHADNWRQTLPLKFRKSGAPVRYAAEQDDIPSISMPSGKPASTSFGTAKDWVVKNDPHSIWLNERHSREGLSRNVGPVRHLTHDDGQLSAVHFVAGHPAQMSPLTTFDVGFNAARDPDYWAGGRSVIHAVGIDKHAHLTSEGSSYLPSGLFSYHMDGSPSIVHEANFDGSSGERGLAERVRHGAIQANLGALEELGVTLPVNVNGFDMREYFTPMFKDRKAAESMAEKLGGYVHTVHIDPSRLRGRRSRLGAPTYANGWYEEQPSQDRFQLVDQRESGAPPSQLDQSVVTLAKHPEYGEYILAHNPTHLTKSYFFNRANHFAGSLSKLERFHSSITGAPSRSSTYARWWADQAAKSHIVPFISQYWRNLIDLHSDLSSDPWNDRYNLPRVLSADALGGDHTPPTRQLIDSMGDAAQHLYAMALADHNDHMPRMVLADMFDEHGHDGAANFMRASIPHHVRRQLKLAKGEKPGASPQPKSVAQQQISPEAASEQTVNKVNDLLAWPGESSQPPAQQPQKQSVSIGDRVHLHHPSGHRVDDGVYTLDDMDKNYYTLSMVGENVPGYQRGIRIPKTDAKLRPAPAEQQFQRGDQITFRQYNNRIYEATYGRPISRKELDETGPAYHGSDWHEVYKKGEDSPTWITGGDINPQQTAATQQAPEPAKEQRQQQFPAPLAPLRHPEISPRLSFEDNAHKLESGDIIHTYFNYVDEDGKSHTRLLHSQPRIFDRIDHEGGVFYSRRVHDDGHAGSVILAAPSTAEHETPTFAIIQRAQTTRDRQAAGLPSLAEPNEPAPRQLTPEQISDAHFNVGDDVVWRKENGEIETGTYKGIRLSPSGEIEHVVSGYGDSRFAVKPEDVWHFWGGSSTHEAFRGPSSWNDVWNISDGARIEPNKRVWVNTHNRAVGMNASPGGDFLNSYRRATVLKRNRDGTVSVRLDGGENAIDVSRDRLRENRSQDPAYFDAFNGSPVSVIDSASGELHHGKFIGMVNPNSADHSVIRAAISDAGMPFGEIWTDPNRNPEKYVSVVEIRTPQGPLPIAVENQDVLPRFAQGVTHNRSARDPRATSAELLLIANAIQNVSPETAESMRQSSASMRTLAGYTSTLGRRIDPPVFATVSAGRPPAWHQSQPSPAASSSQPAANAPPIEKKLERMIFNAGERNYDDVAESLRDKFGEIFGEKIDDQTIMDILRVPRAFPGADPNHPAFSPENLSLDLSIYSDSVGSTVRSKLPNYKFHASTSVGSGDASNRSQSHSGMRGTHDKFISTPHILQNQANAAHKLGISKLDVNAALTNPVVDPHNGYTGGIVWPTYGYTKDLERISDWDDVQLAEAIAIARRNNPDLHAIDDSELTLNHLLDSKEGIDWYTQNEPHRHGGKNYLNATSGHMVFHTDPNSISHRILARKVRRLEQNAASRSNPS